MIKAILIFLVLFSYMDCEKNSNIDRANKDPNQVGANSSATITLERTGCYGMCPQYTLTIKPDGSTAFDGKKDTAVIGHREGKISRSDYEGLLRQFYKVGFDKLKPEYNNDTCPTYATDHPTAIVSLTADGKTKTVKHYLGCVTDDDKHESFPPGLKSARGPDRQSRQYYSMDQGKIGVPAKASDLKGAADGLIRILQNAYSGEVAAAYAYRGHWRSLKEGAERSRIKEIEAEEWDHRRRVGEWLCGLNAKPRAARDKVFWTIGRMLGLTCHLSGWFLPMYFAGRLESGNVEEYEDAAAFARELGMNDCVDDLLDMARVEGEHEAFFRQVVARHKMLPTMMRFFKWS